MVARFRSWWQQIKTHPVTTGLIALVLALVVLVILGGYLFHWDWAGFNGKIKSGKTLWDWMQLLIVPLVLAIGGLWFNQIQKTREHEASEQNAKIERELASDNQREALLQSYLDRMAELLLDKHLMDEEVNNKARDIARAQTLTVLSRLDPVRKAHGMRNEFYLNSNPV